MSIKNASIPPITNLRCENVLNPLGVEAPQPRLSWQLAAPAHGEKQASYRILVASNPELLAQSKGDLWDSGIVRSDQTTEVVYRGKPLGSNARVFWKVCVVDSFGKTLESAPATWNMGLHYADDWHGQWIGYTPPKAANKSDADVAPTLQNASWIWFPEGNPASSAPIATRWFRRTFSVPGGRTSRSAQLRVVADNDAVVYLNGKKVGRVKDSWKTTEWFDVRNALVAGANTLAIAVSNARDTAANVPNPAGVSAGLEVRFAQGEPFSLVTNGNWKTSNQQTANWQNADFNDATWQGAQVLVPVNQGPWGRIAQGASGAAQGTATGNAAPMLRHTFALKGKVKRATAFICGLGYYEMSLNGRKVGDHMLDPGWTRYDRRSLYVAHDVTSYLQPGQNAVGVILGTGHFDDHVLSVWDFDNATWRAPENAARTARGLRRRAPANNCLRFFMESLDRPDDFRLDFGGRKLRRAFGKSELEHVHFSGRELGSRSSRRASQRHFGRTNRAARANHANYCAR